MERLTVLKRSVVLWAWAASISVFSVHCGGPTGWHRPGQRDDASPLGLGDAEWPAHAGPVTQPVQALGVEPGEAFRSLTHLRESVRSRLHAAALDVLVELCLH
jgi:hypothetical protein